MNNNTEIMKDIIISSLEDDKAEDIELIDLAGKTDIANYMILATGRVEGHIASMADHIKLKLKEQDLCDEVTIEGKGNSKWILLDAYDIIVHLFCGEAREDYDLAGLWKNMAKGSNLSNL